MYNIPLGIMNVYYVEELGEYIGEVIKLYVDKEGIRWGPYLKVKVWVDTSKPLIRGKLINFIDNHSWIAFKYK